VSNPHYKHKGISNCEIGRDFLLKRFKYIPERRKRRERK